MIRLGTSVVASNNSLSKEAISVLGQVLMSNGFRRAGANQNATSFAFSANSKEEMLKHMIKINKLAFSVWTPLEKNRTANKIQFSYWLPLLIGDFNLIAEVTMVNSAVTIKVKREPKN